MYLKQKRIQRKYEHSSISEINYLKLYLTPSKYYFFGTYFYRLYQIQRLLDIIC